MKLKLLQEPELIFGNGSHIDIKFGLMQHGPFDAKTHQSPREIKLGVIGTNDTIEGLEQWLNEIKKGIPGKTSKKENLFPMFPGYGEGTNLPASFVFETGTNRIISQSMIKSLPEAGANQVVRTIVDLFYEEAKYLCEKKVIDVLVFALPYEILTLLQSLKSDFNFRDMLKAKVMSLKKPCQLVLPTTYNMKSQGGVEITKRKPQDESTRAWNFYVALYYKAGGIPWRIQKKNDEFSTCYIGIGFYNTLDKESIETSVAQIFNERGEGIILRGEQAHFSKEDRHPHMNCEDAYKIIVDSLQKYKTEHGTLPARVVVYKTSHYTDDELQGIEQAIKEKEVQFFDCISIRQSEVKLLRTHDYPPLRGTFCSLDDQNHILYTRGSVQFYESYPGMYIPVPLSFYAERIEQTPNFLAEEILSLTKLNWNNTQFDNSLPITLSAALKVSKVLKYLRPEDNIESRYSYYI